MGRQPIAGPSPRTRDDLPGTSVPRPPPAAETTRLYKADRAAFATWCPRSGRSVPSTASRTRAWRLRMPPPMTAPSAMPVRRRRSGPVWRGPFLSVALAAFAPGIKGITGISWIGPRAGRRRDGLGTFDRAKALLSGMPSGGATGVLGRQFAGCILGFPGQGRREHVEGQAEIPDEL
jgi:hypothetical protein